MKPAVSSSSNVAGNTNFRRWGIRRRTRLLFSTWMIRFFIIQNLLIQKPSIVFDREREWSDLVRFATSPTARLGVVYGRRRLGKTHLVEQLASATNGLYFCAAQQSSAANLADLGRMVSSWTGTYTRYESWDDALSHLLHMPASNGGVIVFDEVGYLIEESPSFPSLLQRALDRRPRPTIPLLLSGSAQAVMRELAASGKPLRGRAQLELVVHPFDFRTSSAFWGVSNARLAVLVWSVVGGTPGYRELCDDEAPRSEAQFPNWLGQHVLSPSAALHREGRIVIAEEAALSEPTSHWAVLAAVTSGATTRERIAEQVRRPSTSLSNSLRVLTSSGLIERVDDPLHARRSQYRVAEPIVTAWKELVEPIERRVIRRDPQELFDDIESALHDRVVAPAFEQLVRSWADYTASPETMGGNVTAVGASMIGRSFAGPDSAQIDLVAIERSPSGQPRLLAIGETKHRLRPVGLVVLHRLEELRERLSKKGTGEIRLLIACDAGFDRDLVRIARKRSDIELIDADRLLMGD